MVFHAMGGHGLEFILRCLRQLLGGKSDTLSVHVCLWGVGDCIVSLVKGKNPQTQQDDLDFRWRGESISHQCIGDLEDFFGYTLREDPSLIMVNFSSCSARNPFVLPLASLLFFLLFFLFAISLYQIHRARLVPRSSDLRAISYMSFQFSSRQFLFFSCFVGRGGGER